MLEHVAANGARTIIIEMANRFARDLIVQEAGHRMLKAKGIEIIAADSPTAFVDDTPTATFVRQVLGAVAQLDKAMTVAKLSGARERKRRQAGWCEGGALLHVRFPEAVRLAKRLRRANPVTGQRRSLRKISAELAAAGHKMARKYRGSEVPRPFNPATIKAMIPASSLTLAELSGPGQGRPCANCREHVQKSMYAITASCRRRSGAATQ